MNYYPKDPIQTVVRTKKKEFSEHPKQKRQDIVDLFLIKSMFLGINSQKGLRTATRNKQSYYTDLQTSD